MENETEILKAKLQQAREVIAKLIEDADIGEFEARRLLEYFTNTGFDPAFQLEVPQEEGLRPEELSAANDG